MTTDASPPAERLLVVVLGQRRFGLPLEQVRGIQARTPGSATAAYRDGLIPIVEAGVLGLGAEAGGGAGEVVVLGASDGEMGLAVDRVEGFFDAGEIRDLPGLVAPFVRGVFRGIALRPGGGLLVVDTAALARVVGVDPAEGGRERHDAEGPVGRRQCHDPQGRGAHLLR
ncbi:MAG TPA: chemotaxis protein CheW [bacterium]